MNRRRSLLLSALFLAAGLGAEPLSSRERESLAAEARALFDGGRFAEARGKWDRAIGAGASRAEARRWRPWVGRAFEAEGNYQKALTAYQEAFDGDPKNVDRMVDLARVYDTVELDERALELYDRALGRDGNRRDVLLALAELHRAAGRLADARRHAEEAIRRDPRDPSAQFLLAEIEEAQGDLAGAARRRETVLSSRPSGPEALALGRLWARAGEAELAEQAYRRAAELGVDSPGLLFERGAAAWCRGETDAAKKRLTEALAKDANFVPAAFLLSVLDWERGRKARAAERLRALDFTATPDLAPLRDRLLTAAGAAPVKK